MYRRGLQQYFPLVNGTNPTSSFVGGEFHAQSQQVLRESNSNKIANTNRAYDPKMLEFKQFCASLYGNDYLAPIVTEEKIFAFLFYQAYREKKTKKSRQLCTDSTVSRFDREDYNEVTKKFAKALKKMRIWPWETIWASVLSISTVVR